MYERNHPFEMAVTLLVNRNLTEPHPPQDVRVCFA
jgi:hypothetical protein